MTVTAGSTLPICWHHMVTAMSRGQHAYVLSVNVFKEERNHRRAVCTCWQYPTVITKGRQSVCSPLLPWLPKVSHHRDPELLQGCEQRCKNSGMKQTFHPLLSSNRPREDHCSQRVQSHHLMFQSPSPAAGWDPSPQEVLTFVSRQQGMVWGGAGCTAPGCRLALNNRALSLSAGNPAP